jgi:AraC-like DNA-binding protein
MLGLSAGRRAIVEPQAPALLLTVEAALADVSVGRTLALLDRSGCVVLPRGARANLLARGPACRVALLSFHDPAFDNVARLYKRLGLDKSRLRKWTQDVALLPRTAWVHEIVHRYVFERATLGQHKNQATRFLETEILKEVYFLFRDRDEGAERESTYRRHSARVVRALAHIEAHLFEHRDLQDLTQHAGASPATLLRAFRKELGMSPGAWWRNRVLDEALALVRSGAYSVSEIATRVGYENPAAFTFAFRQRFGRAPREFFPKLQTRPAP